MIPDLILSPYQAAGGQWPVQDRVQPPGGGQLRHGCLRHRGQDPGQPHLLQGLRLGPYSSEWLLPSTAETTTKCILNLASTDTCLNNLTILPISTTCQILHRFPYSFTDTLSHYLTDPV